MKKKIVAFLIVSFLSVLLYFHCFILCGLIVVGGSFIYLIHAFCNKLISELQGRYHTWTVYRKDLKRDYESAYIGDASIYYDMKHHKNVLDWTLPDQSIDLMFEIIKRYFSVLKDDGQIHLSILATQLNLRNAKELSLFFYPLLHHWLIPDYDKDKLGKLKYIYFYEPLFFIKLIKNPIVKMFSKTPRVEKVCRENIIYNIDLIEKINDFCSERKISFSLHVETDFSSKTMVEIYDIFYANKPNKITII
jgi:hypothetical protein